MTQPIVDLVKDALARFERFKTANADYFPSQAILYPIPFFGDIRKAAVLTLALNPAWTEFRDGRHWLPKFDAYALTTRLLYYFDLPTPAPHRWFRDRQDALASLECSYATNAAHIDLHPLPTKFRRDLTEVQRANIGRAIENRSAVHLATLLRLATQVRLLLVVDYIFTKPDGTLIKTSDFISTHKPIVDSWGLLEVA